MLITCSNCGRQISDKSKQCIHCGAAIAEKESEAENAVTKRDFMTFSDAEREVLFKEFKREHPEHLKAMEREEKLLKVWKSLLILTGVFLVAVVLHIVINKKFLDTPKPPQWVLALLFSLLVLSVLSVVGWGVVARLLKKTRTQVLVGLKQYKAWLEKKNIENVTFMFQSAEEAKGFDGIDIDKA